MHFLLHLRRQFLELMGADLFSNSLKRLKDGQIGRQFDQLFYCKNPTYARFLKMAHDGNIYLDFMMAMQDDKFRDQGFLWRVP